MTGKKYIAYWRNDDILCIKEGSNKIGELRLAAIFAPALSASVSSCAKKQALGFLLGFQQFSIHFTIEPDFERGL